MKAPPQMAVGSIFRDSLSLTFNLGKEVKMFWIMAATSAVSLSIALAVALTRLTHERRRAEGIAFQSEKPR
jgi:hypothetical protein